MLLGPDMRQPCFHHALRCQPTLHEPTLHMPTLLSPLPASGYVCVRTTSRESPTSLTLHVLVIVCNPATLHVAICVDASVRVCMCVCMCVCVMPL